MRVLGIDQFKISLILLLLTVASVSGLGGRKELSVFAAGFDNSRNETGSIDAPVSPYIPAAAILTTSKNTQNAARLNRMDNFYSNQGASSLVQNIVTMTVLKKDLKIDKKNTIIIKLRI